MLANFSRGVFLLLFLITSSFSSFVLENSNILTSKSIKKIDEIASELYNFSNISVYVVAIKSLNSKDIKEYENEIAQKLKGEFVILTFSLDEKKIDIFSNIKDNELFDKDSILDDYMIPILISKGDDFNKYQAAIFNGFAEITDEIAESLNITLSSSIGSEGKHVYDIAKAVIWFMLLSFLAVFLYIRRG